jgi:hypothetical protein
LHAQDDLATSLLPEMLLAVGILQGLCLLSGRAKGASGEEWAIEVSAGLHQLL